MFKMKLLVFLCFALTNTVKCDDAIRTKKEIIDMQEHAKELSIDNEGLVKKLEKLKHTCESNLEPLRKKQELEDQQHLVETKRFEKISNELLQKNEEEQLLSNALQGALVQNRKYTVQIQLLTEDIEMMTERKRDGKAKMCQQFKGLFPEYESTLSVRSSGNFRVPIKSKKDEIVVLQNQLNREKLRVKSLMNENKELRIEIESFSRRCDEQVSLLQNLLSKSQEELKELLANLESVSQDLQEVTASVKDLETQLTDLRSNNEQLKNKSIQLKNNLAPFNQDMECYRQLGELNIHYQ